MVIWLWYAIYDVMPCGRLGSGFTLSAGNATIMRFCFPTLAIMTLQLAVYPVTLFRQNCTLLWDDASREGVLVDTGGDETFLLSEVQRLGIELKAVWLTHGHLDHAGGAAAIQATGIPVIGPHREDGYLLERLPEITAQYAAHGFPICPAVTPDTWLNEGDEVQIGDYRFVVLHIPGHTPGHVVFYCEAANLLLAGDTLFRESIGRTDFPRGSHADLIHHIKTKLLRLPEDTQVLPGHGMMTTIGHEKRYNPFLND